MFTAVIFFILLCALNVNTQTSFSCVPTGTCPTPSGTGIELRIMAPTCPTGQEPCYTTATLPTISCGRSYNNASMLNTGNGPTVAGAYPWLAFIENQGKYVGVGSLLSPTTVLTAAHKVYSSRSTPNDIRVTLGRWNFNTPETQSSLATTFAIPDNYSNVTFKNDIALIKLSTPIALGQQKNVNTACLPPASANGQSPYVGRNCVVAGWGQTAFGANDAPTALQKQANVRIVEQQQCMNSMAKLGVSTYLDTIGEICAGGEDQIDACTQDGGAPLMCPDPVSNRLIVAGIVIWGKKCGSPGVYGVYVNVPVYRNWIDSNI